MDQSSWDHDRDQRGYPPPYHPPHQGFPPPPGYPPHVAGMPPGHGYPVVAPKNPAVSLIISFFLPGVGSMVNGEAAKGVFILLGYLFSYLLMFVLIGFLTAPIFWIWGMIDAYQGAQSWNARHGIIS